MEDLVDTLPVLHRLALSYAPAAQREPTLALLALDGRLASIVRSASEPMLAQVRLAWWRDMLERNAADRPSGEPLLAALNSWAGQEAGLAALVDGWEHLVGPDPLDAAAIKAFCAGRGAAFRSLATLLGCNDHLEDASNAGEGWALASLAANLDAPSERELAVGMLRERRWQHLPLPRAMRPLAVLYGLAARDAKRGRGLGAPTASMLLPAFRIGLFGR